MKKVLKSIMYFVIGIVLFLVLFILWASSSNYKEKDYSKLIINNYSTQIPSDSIYSIITYNIGYLSGMTNNRAIAKSKKLFDVNLKKVKRELVLLNADILALQEIDYASARSYNVNQQSEIAKLGYNYICQAINWDKKYVPFPYWPPSTHFGKIVSGQSILSKYPLSNHKRVVLERVENSPFYRNAFYLERLAQVATIKIENKDVIVINIHFEAYDKPTRIKQLNTVIDLFNTYRKEYPTILLGDFNSDPSYEDPAVDKLFTLNNVGNAAFNDVYDFTFSSANPIKRLDYIFYSKNSIEMIESNVLKQFGEASDHLPIEMKFKLR